jgi:hypothetical protein
MLSNMSIDPRLRVLYLLGIAVGVFFVHDFWQLGAVLAVQVALWFVVRLPAGRLLRQIVKLWAFGLFVVATYAVFEQDPETDRWVRYMVLGLEIPINMSGIVEGAAMLLRLVTVVLASQVARAGDPRAIVQGLQRLRVPASIALSLDIVLALLGDNKGGGRGTGGGGGRGRRESEGDSFWQSVKRLARGDVSPVVKRIETQIARAEEHASEAPPDLRRDVAVVAGIALTMLAIKALKVLPSIPFAPGHKLVLLTPLYIVAAVLTRSRWGATLTGLTMGTVAFLMGDGRYGIFEVLKHITPGLICDALMPLMLRREPLPGGVAWSLFGGLIAAGRFATIFAVTLVMQPPAFAWAILAPGLAVNVFFGVASGYVSYHVVRAALRMRDARERPSKERETKKDAAE